MQKIIDMKKNKSKIKQEKSSFTSHLSMQAIPHIFETTNRQKYREEITEDASSEHSKDSLSVMVFRLGQQWLALRTVCFKEVTHRRLVHHIPHRSNDIFLGVVNLNGELQLYIALHQLLKIDSSTPSSAGQLAIHKDRMIAIAKEHDLWVFPVDEIDGIYHWNPAAIEAIPLNVSQSTVNYIQGIIKIGDRNIGLLDEELLFSSLKRSVL